MIFPLAGNSGVSSILNNALSFGRVPHAIVIEGESGTGKTVLANFIAKALLCESEEKPCGKCRGCHLADVGSHPDVYKVELLEKRKNISVDQIRKMRVEAYRKPQMSNGRVFIIDRADTMNAQSQNTILKVLEEPPGNTVFILQTESKASLLTTVLSRCVVLSLQSPSFESGLEHLVNTLGINKEEAANALKKSRNNIGRALLYLGKAQKKESEQMAEQYLKALDMGDTYAMLKITAPLISDRAAAEEFFACLQFLLLSRLRDAENNPELTKRLLALVNKTNALMVPLKTNINLALLFTNAAYEYKGIYL